MAGGGGGGGSGSRPIESYSYGKACPCPARTLVEEMGSELPISERGCREEVSQSDYGLVPGLRCAAILRGAQALAEEQTQTEVSIQGGQ